MKRIFLPFLVFSLAFYFSSAQKLSFCESVDESGNPKNSSSTFTINPNGGFVNVLVSMPKGINSELITYDIFYIDADKTEMFESTIKQNVQPDFTWFSKEITFHKSGNYNLYVYDDKDQLLCVGRVKIKMEK
jgi:hypothetical protein